MSSEHEGRQNSLSLKTLSLLHRYLDDFAQVGKARRGELSSVELHALLLNAVVDPEEIQEILLHYEQFRQA
jgi:hypothetical protein